MLNLGAGLWGWAGLGCCGLGLFGTIFSGLGWAGLLWAAAGAGAWLGWAGLWLGGLAGCGLFGGAGGTLKRKLVYLKMEGCFQTERKTSFRMPTATSNFYFFLS